MEILDKFRHDKKGRKIGRLAVGVEFRFSSGRSYQVTQSGALIRVDRKPWNNKAERKRYIRARRAARESMEAL